MVMYSVHHSKSRHSRIIEGRVTLVEAFLNQIGNQLGFAVFNCCGQFFNFRHNNIPLLKK